MGCYPLSYKYELGGVKYKITIKKVGRIVVFLYLVIEKMKVSSKKTNLFQRGNSNEKI